MFFEGEPELLAEYNFGTGSFEIVWRPHVYFPRSYTSFRLENEQCHNMVAHIMFILPVPCS